MPQFRLKNFSDLAFLQTVDKPNVLGKLLAPHREYFKRQGLDIARLSNDDACARQLLAIFTKTVETLPDGLLHALHLIGEMSGEEGHERIVQEAARLGAGLPLLSHGMTSGDFAILAFLGHPELVRMCHEKAVARKVKRYYEYPSHDARRFGLGDFEAAISGLKAVLGLWFEGRRRSRASEIFLYRDGGEVRILVTHGGLFRADGNVTGALQFSRLGWRPQEHDSIIYDGATGILKIHARFEPDRRFYLQSFGQALAGDPAFFMDEPPYTLAPLRNGSLRLVDGICEARLTEALIETDSAKWRQIALKGDDVMETFNGLGSYAVPPAEIVRANFALRFASGGHPRRLEMRLPNIADYDRERDGEVYEAFIHANGFHVIADWRDEGVARQLVDAD
ncbi:MAG TPA: hypothetical protein VFG05_04920 [Methylocella sp.]|nr:hypothetical protein [Methylocella sp.]